MMSFHMIRRLVTALLLVASFGLSGCMEVFLRDSRVQGALSGDQKAKDELLAVIKDPKNEVFNRASMESAYGDDFIYLPENWYAMATRDVESYLKYVVGPLLVRNNVTWEVAAQYNLTNEATFNYYKGFGAAYVDSLKSNPRNAWLEERLAMFKARAGKNYDPGLISWHEAWKLLRSDADFKLFLTDNQAAANWLFMARSYSNNGFESDGGTVYQKLRNLGPIGSGILPNASP